jgi:hypothetical protein
VSRREFDPYTLLRFVLVRVNSWIILFGRVKRTIHEITRTNTEGKLFSKRLSGWKLWSAPSLDCGGLTPLSLYSRGSRDITKRRQAGPLQVAVDLKTSRLGGKSAGLFLHRPDGHEP